MGSVMIHGHSLLTLGSSLERWRLISLAFLALTVVFKSAQSV